VYTNILASPGSQAAPSTQLNPAKQGSVLMQHRVIMTICLNNRRRAVSNQFPKAFFGMHVSKSFLWRMLILPPFGDFRMNNGNSQEYEG